MGIDTKDWPSYRSIKMVKAKEIASLSEAKDLITFTDGTTMVPVENMFARATPVAGDFVVIYEGGYVSFSPNLPFITGYVRS